MDAVLLARELEEFLAIAPHARVLEEGETLFDLSAAKYSISGENGKCLLHLWSQERNAVRRVVAVEQKHGQLRLAVCTGMMLPPFDYFEHRRAWYVHQITLVLASSSWVANSELPQPI